MNSKDKETLSQLMDGEWQDLDAPRCVKSACSDHAQKETWARYHLIRDVIRNDSISVDGALTSRIHDAIADEPTYSNVSSINTALNTDNNSVALRTPDTTSADGREAPKRSNRWGSAFGGLALAASVALATVVGLNMWQGAPDSGSNGVIGAQTVASSTNAVPNQNQTLLPGAVLPQVEYVANRGTYWVMPEAKRSPAMEKKLNSFLSQHIENSPTAERSGMLPYSRLVGYDSVVTEQ